jgi:fibro-slime domain-containing protein
MKHLRNGAIPLLAVLLCLSIAVLQKTSMIPSGVELPQRSATVSVESDALQEIKDDYPPKASFAPEEEEMFDELEGSEEVPEEDSSAEPQEPLQMEVKAEETSDISVEEQEEEDESPLRTLTVDNRNCAVMATVPSEAGLSEDAELLVKQVKADSKQYRSHWKKTEQMLAEDSSLYGADETETVVPEFDSFMLFDISFTENGQEVEPDAPVSVELKLKAKKLVGTENALVLHFDQKNGAEVVENQNVDCDEKGNVTATFESEAFSYYAFVVTRIEKNVLASDGKNYKITVSYGTDAGIPEHADLAVQELKEDAYEDYLARTAVAMDAAGFAYARIFDISIVDSEDSSVTYQPQAPVEVKIELMDAETEKQPFSVVHFDREPEILEADTDGNKVSFSTDGFSAYAIVQGPEAVPLGWTRLTSLDDLENVGGSVYIGHTSGYYFTSGITKIKGTRTGITKTTPAQSFPPDNAVQYHFEKESNSSNRYKVFCLDGTTRKYIIQKSDSLNLTTDEGQATVFTIEPGNDENMFHAIGDSNYCWNMQGGANGKSFAAYQGENDVNAQFYFWYNEELQEEPFDLDGKTYGLMNWNGGASGRAMMSSVSDNNNTALTAKPLTVMSQKTDNEDKLFVPNNSDISMWTFEWVKQDKYKLKTTVGEGTKYLKVDANGLTLVDENDASELQVIPGTGAHAGEICLKSGNATLTYSGKVDDGFSTGGSTGNEWLHLVKSSELTDDYFMPYSASKVSVADTKKVSTGEKILVYTRAWNETKKKYDFYAIDHDGTLKPCYESGDSIEWVGGSLNTMLWQFTQYENDDGTPNYYYELYNQYSGKFISPQVADGQILSDDPIGINLNGRRNGKYYSTILAWDDDSYAYAGLKVENGKIVACPKSEAMDFYFAVMDEIPVDDELHTVPTVDHVKNGITMKIVDIDTRKEMSDFLNNDKGGAVTTLQQGLLSTNLGGDGYPTVTSGDFKGQSLLNLYSGSNRELKEVNHLFIESTYRASGYYEYDSTQNFASLNGESGDFTVYKEIGSYDTSGNTTLDRNTLKHGQFFPFNDLEAGLFTSVNGKNLYSATAQMLPDSDPRKYEQLYMVRDVDCYFGVELKASFVQTPDGLDDWGHDIIYEFTGDDDFWLYVDGELVIDLGGIHSAVPGSVNFRTGEVNVNGKKTTLKDLFYKNYLGRDNHTREQAEKYVNDLFQQNSEGQWVFKDNTTHTMRIFYMERGAGASNLHMRFNLSSIKPGTVLLSKELGGVDATESTLAQFAYQIKYKKGNEEAYLTDKTDTGKTKPVVYKESDKEVPFRESLTIGGVDYENVFLLKPGEIAEINFPTYGADNETVDSYSIVECGVNTDVYSKVFVNETEITGTPVSDSTVTNRKDYSTGEATTENRARVAYKNEVKPDALQPLTIKKKLYDETGIHEKEHELTGDSTKFDFRLYLATEFDDLNDSLTNMYTYHLKDRDGNYCKWDSKQKKLVSIGKSDYSKLTPEEKKAVSFTTSMYGTISKVPVFYTVEIRNLLAGTQYRVEERPKDVPDGYSFQQYGKDTSASEEDRFGVSGVVDTMVTGRASHVDVCNLKGWGLRVNKVWTDKDYMTERDETFFAVFTRGGANDDTLTLVDGTVRQLEYGKTTLYWYFDKLPVTGVNLNHYEIREVVLSSETPTVDENGVVTDYGTVTPIDQNGTLTMNGKQKGETDSGEFTYTVRYDKGEISVESNVRVDTVTNDRPGVILKKEDWSGQPLAGADISLEEGNVTIGTFTSGSDGTITVAFLSEKKDYTLTETKTPQGYHGLDTPMTIRLSGGDLTVSGAEEAYYQKGKENGMPTLTIKNQPFTFKAVKIDDDTKAPLKDVSFALHKETTVGDVTQFDTSPMKDYDNLVTDADGIVPKLDNTLPAGTYQLREKTESTGYQKLSAYIHFSVSPTGAVTLADAPSDVTLTSEEQNGTLSYLLTIPNKQQKTVQIQKVDSIKGTAVEGAKFDLYEVNGDNRKEPALYSDLISDSDGMLYIPVEAKEKDAKKSEPSRQSAFDLPVGTYHLVETEAPEEYLMKTDPFVIVVSVAEPGKEVSCEGYEVSYNSGLYTLKAPNTLSYNLPSSGSIGTYYHTTLGVAAMAFPFLFYLRGRRKEQS